MSKKVTLGIVAFWPIIYLFFFVIYSFSQISKIYEATGEGMLPSESSFPIWLSFLGVVSILTALVIYVIDVFKNNKVKKDLKAVWAIILFVGNVIAMPIYWYLYIWKDEKQK